MKLSYCITVCNEFLEIQELLCFLSKNKRKQDEIVVLFDTSHGNKEISNYLRSHSDTLGVRWHEAEFKNNFSEWKNYLNSLCTGDYIVNIDADESISKHLIDILPEILELNPEVDLYAIPRVNTVKGLTENHIRKWGWQVNEWGWVNWPDLQTRIYKNTPEIKWEGRVHEKIKGYKTYTVLPLQEEYALQHHKSIEKQESQNNYYETL